MIMMMGLIITMRTSDNGTLNWVCHHTTQAVACYYTPRTWRGAGFGPGKGPSWAGGVRGGQTPTWQPPYLAALGYHQENNWN